MPILRVFLELRFLTNSLEYISKGMDIAADLSDDYPQFQTNGIAITFTTNPETGSTLSLDPGRVLVALNSTDCNQDQCRIPLTKAIHAWTKHIRRLPTLQRTGLRFQTVFGSEMTRQELIEIYSGHIFNDAFMTKREQGHDFLIVLEKFVDNNGDRQQIGVMSHEELVVKWSLNEDWIEHPTPCYLTTDLDFAQSNVKFAVGEVESFLRQTWGIIIERNRALDKRLGASLAEKSA